jgi:hypothetical protein
MAAEDKSIKLNIELEQTGTGGTAAAAELNSVKDAAGAAGGKVEDLSKKVHEGSEHLHLFSGEGREMHHVISELNRISPVLGEALRMAMHPVGGTVAAAIGLFVLMKEHLNEINKELDAMGAKAAEPTFLEGIRAKQQVLAEAADAAAQYAQHLDEIASGEGNITAQLTAQLALQKSINEARAAQASSEEALAQAKIKARVAAGQLTPAEGEALSEKAKRDAIIAADKAKRAAEDQEVLTKTKALEGLDVPSDQANAKALMETYGNEKARREENKKNGDTAEKLKAATDKQIAEITAKLESDPNYIGLQKYRQKEQEDLARGDTYHAGIARDTARQFQTSLNAPDLLGGPSGQDLINLRDVLQTQSGSFGQIKDKAHQDEATEADFNALKVAMDEAKKKAEETTAAQQKLTEELKALNDTITATRGADAANTRAKINETFFNEAGRLGEDITKTEDAQRHFQTHAASKSEADKALADAQGVIKALVQAVQEAGRAHSDALKLLQQELLQQQRDYAALAAQLGRSRSSQTSG